MNTAVATVHPLAALVWIGGLLLSGIIGGPVLRRPRRLTSRSSFRCGPAAAPTGRIGIGRTVLRAFAAAFIGTVAPGGAHAQDGSGDVVLATTTSTRDAGLLDAVGTAFERATHYRLLVVAVGSGQALEMGRRGDADVVLSHSPDAERRLEEQGFVKNRRPVMYNDFVVVGPAADPAHIRGLRTAAMALATIARVGAPFMSRGDQSGTHAKERRLWEVARVTPGGDWYHETGQGMGATLTIAQELRAYTLTDRGTFLSWKGDYDLAILVEGDTVLFNQYHVMEVNPANAPRVNSAGGKAFADFLVSEEGQRLIGGFGVDRFGRALFVPNAVEWPRR